MADCYNLVGFQNHLKFPEQVRLFRMIPGLENAEFLRLGQIHRNTYIHSPGLLHPTLQTRPNPVLFFAGQLCGVEGYVESIATGLLAGINAARLVLNHSLSAPPAGTACGSLVHYISDIASEPFQPVNASFGLLSGNTTDLRPRISDKKERHRIMVEQALARLDQWIIDYDI